MGFRISASQAERLNFIDLGRFDENKPVIPKGSCWFNPKMNWYNMSLNYSGLMTVYTDVTERGASLVLSVNFQLWVPENVKQTPRNKTKL